MTETEIKYLIDNNRWITIQPTKKKKRKAYIYKRILSGWKVEYSTKTRSPEKAYEWVENTLKTIKL